MLVYANSCSFGATQLYLVYPELIANHLQCELINDGTPGACNRRIIRTSLRSLIELRKNQSTDILALIGLSFIGRTELWQPKQSPTATDGDFHPISSDLIVSQDWSKGLINTHINNIHKLLDAEVQDYYKQWLIHFSKEAAVTDLLADIIMLTSYAECNNINIAVFCNCQKFPKFPEVDCSAPFLSSLLEYAKTKKSIINPWEFSFADYALELGHRPADEHIYGINGHPNEYAHKDFAEYLMRHYDI